MSPTEEREAHYQRFFGPLSQPVMHSTDDKAVHIDIYQYAPTEDRPYWTLITGGMSDQRQPLPADVGSHVAPRAELVMYVREPKGWMFSVLKGMAEMPFDANTYLHWHHTVPNGRAMTAEPSLLTSYFFLPPYFESEGFDSLVVGGDRVHILMLIPITEAEREYAVEHGSQALEDIMSEVEFDPVVEESRGSLIPVAEQTHAASRDR
jgi:hypothetical protein